MTRRLRGQMFFWAADSGGEMVKGGRPHSDPKGKGEEEITDTLGQAVLGHRQSGTGNPGTPGSRTNPVRPGVEPKPETEEPVSPPGGEGSGSGS